MGCDISEAIDYKSPASTKCIRVYIFLETIVVINLVFKAVYQHLSNATISPAENNADLFPPL